MLTNQIFRHCPQLRMSVRGLHFARALDDILIQQNIDGRNVMNYEHTQCIEGTNSAQTGSTITGFGHDRQNTQRLT